MSETSLTEAMLAAFARTSAANPGWPDPHPDHQLPLDSEYSRCENPGKYRILPARMRAWSDALTGLGLATVAAVPGDLVRARPDGPWADPPSRIPVSEAWWLRPTRPGALPLLVCLTDFGGATGNGLLLGIGEPAVELAVLPRCGCDACDDGSEQLLDELDEQLLDVVTGAFVRIVDAGTTVIGRRNGFSATSTPGARMPGTAVIEQRLRDARDGRAGFQVMQGAPWQPEP